MSDKKKEYALYMGMKSVEPERSGNAGHARLGVVEVRENGEIRNPEPGHEFNDLDFRCQWHEKMGDPFAFGLEYSGGCIELRDAERMVKLLRRARKVEKAFPVDAVTFGQWAVLMARGLGITKLVKHVSGSGMSFADNEHRTFALSEAQHVIDRAVLDCRQERTVLV